MNPHSEQLAIAIVLERMFSASSAFAHRASTIPGQLKAIAQRYPSVTRNDIDNLRWAPWKESFPKNRVLFLAPPNASTIAALWYKWNFRAEYDIQMCKFYYGLWKMGDPHPKPPAPVKRTPMFIGFRFEPPEVLGLEHSFFHSQPCRSMGDRAVSDPFSTDVEVTEPAMPIAAKNAVDLLLCLYLALYGVPKFRKFSNELTNEPRVRRNRELTDALKRVGALAMR